MQQPTVDVVVPASATTETLQNMQELVKPKPKPGFESNRRTGPEVKSLFEFLRPREVSSFVVDRYSPEVGWTAVTLKSQLPYVLTARMEGMFSQDIWSEYVLWSVAATLTFRDGTQGKIFLDADHGCYQDPEGYRWFFRYQRKPMDG